MNKSLSTRVRYGLAYLQAGVFTVLFSNMVWVPYALANPEGGTVTGGSGTITQPNSNTTNINQNSQNMAIDWHSYNVGKNEVVNYYQPNSSALSLNRVTGTASASQIFGQINANGQVILLNPHGVVFQPGSIVNTGGIVAGTLNMNPTDFMNGNYAMSEFVDADGKIINGKVVNFGIINAAVGGNVALIGKQVQNDGLIAAKLGSVTLAAGKEAVLTFDQQGLLGVKVTKEVLQSEIGVDPAVLNSGEILAEGGQVLLTASVSQDVFSGAVNTSGVDAATSVVIHEDGSFTLGGGADVVNSGSVDVSQATSGNAKLTTAVTRYNKKHVIPAQNTVTDQNTVVIKLQEDGSLNTAENAILDSLLARDYNDSNDQNTSNRGGRIALLGQNVTSSGDLHADASNGNGGEIELHAMDTSLLTNNSKTTARSEANGKGGIVKVLGDKVGLFDQSTVDVSGANGGGQALIGGDYQGKNSSIRNARRTFVSSGSTLYADALLKGDGGKLINWGDEYTWFYGSAYARGGTELGDGGLVEISGKGLSFDGAVDTSTVNGETGTLLFDPDNIEIENSYQEDNPDSDDDDELNANVPDGQLAGRILAADGGTDTFKISEKKLQNINKDTNIILQANKDIKVKNLKDDLLALKMDSGNSVTMIADFNNDGVGEFKMDDYNDVISTAGGSVIIKGASVSVGKIVTRGGAGVTGGEIQIEATSDAGNINLYGDLDSSGNGASANGGNVTLTGDVTLHRDITINAERGTSGTNGNVLFKNTLVGLTNRNQALTITANNVDFEGNVGVGDTNRLGDLTINATGRVDATTREVGSGDIVTRHNINSGSLDVNSSTSFTSGNIDIVGADGDAGVNGEKVEIDSSGNIDVRSVNTTGSNNRNGGQITLRSISGAITTGSLTSDGGNTTTGANGNDGNNGGDITISTDSSIQINSAISTVGTNGNDRFGTAPGRPGGNGGAVSLTSDTGNITLASSITTNGGNGNNADNNPDHDDTANGGNAGKIEIIQTDKSGIIYLQGDLLAKGGQMEPGDGSAIGGVLNGVGGNVLLDGNVRLDNNITIDARTNGTLGTLTHGDVEVTGTVVSDNDRARNLIIYGKNVSFRDNVGQGANNRLNQLNITATGNVEAVTRDIDDVITDRHSITASSLNVAQSTQFISGNIDTQGNLLNPEALIPTVTINAASGILTVGDIDTSGIAASGNSDGYNGGNVTLNASDIVVGKIDTSGGAASGAGIRNGGHAGQVTITATDDANNGTPSITLAGDIDTRGGAAGDDGGTVGNATTTSLTLAGANNPSGTIAITHTGNFTSSIVATGTGGTDTINAAVRNNAWAITSATSGTLNSNFTFNNIERLVGNTGVDIYTLHGTAIFTGSFIGGTGSSVDEVRGGNRTNIWSITNTGNTGEVTGLSGTYSGVEKLVGSGQKDTFNLHATHDFDGSIDGGGGTLDEVKGANQENIWTITGAGNTGEVTGLTGTFTAVEILTGNEGRDEFNMHDTINFSGKVDGAGGTNDKLIAGNMAINNWNVTDAGIGTLNLVTSFDGIENLTGNAGQDNFDFQVGGSISGLVDGDGGDTDTLDLLDANGGYTVQLGTTVDSNINVDNIETITAAGTGNEIIGANQQNTWKIGATTSVEPTSGAASDNTTTFSGFDTITGGLGIDVFDISANYAGTINGGLAADTSGDTFKILADMAGLTYGGKLNGSDGNDTFDIQAANVTFTQQIDGGGGTGDTIQGHDEANYWNITGNNTGTISVLTVTGPPATVGAQRLSFTGIENMTGGTADDYFAMGAGTTTFGGTINGGVDTGYDVFDIAGWSGTETEVPMDRVLNFELLQGGGAGSGLYISGDGNFTWQITGENSGKIGEMAFSNFADLYGSDDPAGNDTFILKDAGRVTGSINGRGGTNTLETGDTTPDDAWDINNIWIVDDNRSGRVYRSAEGLVFATDFTGIDNLVGGEGVDAFTISGVGVVTNNVNGSGGRNSLTINKGENTWNINGDYAGTVTTGIGTGFSNIHEVTGSTDNDSFGFGANDGHVDKITGGGGTDSITGHNLTNDWEIDGVDAGTLSNTATSTIVNPPYSGKIRFEGITRLIGNSRVDTFNITSTGVNMTDLVSPAQFNIDGRGGTDRIVGANENSYWVVNGANQGAIYTNSIDNIEKLRFDDVEELHGHATGGDDYFKIDTGGSIVDINGGGGTNTLEGRSDIESRWEINTTNRIRNHSNSAIYVSSFSNIQTALGAGNVDRFNISTNFAGVLNGGGGNDFFTIQTTGLADVNVVGGDGNDTFTAEDESNYWRVVGNGQVNVYSADPGDNPPANSEKFNISQIEHLTGGDQGDDFVFVGTGFVAGQILGGGGSDTVNISALGGLRRVLLGTAGDLNDAVSDIYLNIDGVEGVTGNNNSMLYGENTGNAWDITGQNAGTVTRDSDDFEVGFSGFNRLVGGNGDDRFSFSADPSLINGLIMTSINGGAGGTNRITGADYNTFWRITNSNSGLLSRNEIGTNRYLNSFSNIQELYGNSAADSFILVGNLAEITGVINGGAYDVDDETTYNTLTASESFINEWNITDNNIGNVTRVNRFESIQNLTGANSKNDTYIFAVDGSLDGLIDGRGHAAGEGDNVYMTSLEGAITVVMDEDVTNIEFLYGNDHVDSELIGTTGTNTWVVTGVNTGTINTTTEFHDFRNLSGNDSIENSESVDLFTINNGGEITGLIDGAGGASDELNLEALGDVVVVLGDGTMPADDDLVYANPDPDIPDEMDIANADKIRVDGVETIIANAAADDRLIVGPNRNNTWRINQENNGTVEPTDLEVVPANQKVSFRNFNHVRGGDQNDIFRVGENGSVTGLIDGAAHPDGGGDIINSLKDGNEFTLGGDISVKGLRIINFEGISAVNGILKARNGTTTTWLITGDGFGVVSDTGIGDEIPAASMTFEGFTTLNGGDGVDNYTVEDEGVYAGTMNGNEQNDTLTVNAGGTFNGVFNGNSGQDDITLNTGSTVNGTINGNEDLDSLTVTLSGVENGSVRFNGGDDGSLDVITINGNAGEDTYAEQYNPNIADPSGHDQMVYQNQTNGTAFTVNIAETETKNDNVVADLTVNGTSAADEITLTDSTYHVNTAVNSNSVNYTNKDNITLAGGDTDTVTIASNINLNTITLMGQTINSGTNRITATDLFLNQADNTNILTNVENINILNSGLVNISDNGAVNIASMNTSGNVTLSATDVTSSGGLISSGTLNINATGDIDLFDAANQNQFSGPLNLSAVNINLNNAILVDLGNITATGNLDVVSNPGITDSGNILVDGIATFTTENDIVLDSEGNDLNVVNLTARNARIVDEDDLTVQLATITEHLETDSHGLAIGSIRADTVDLDAGDGGITDTQGGVNIYAEEIKLRSTTGIGSGIGENGDPLEVNTAYLDVMNDIANANDSVVNILNHRDVFVKNLTNTGSIRFVNNGDVTVANINAGLTSNQGSGHINLRVSGSLYGSVPPEQIADITGNSGLIYVEGQIGTINRPVVLRFNGPLHLYSQVSTIRFFNDITPVPFFDTSDITRVLSQNYNVLQLIDVESLAEIDPAIFTEVRNYYHEDLAIMMPVDQLYSDDEEERRRKMSEKLQQ
ncbi:MAG: filamentous hemagglutinin N-terminal domain-containing protein [Gammaproteobacteria bacterium]|nr:filamentous hemagglutinin N-terminal domain-containing protein [Gammaproteobacteria bacterium]